MISVIIPCYNCGTFVERAIASAFAQDSECEVIVVDDCSSDDTISRLHYLKQKKFPQLRILQTPRNLGAGGARNVGIDNAKGEWIAVLDADDAFLPGRVSHLLAIGNSSAIVADNPSYFDGEVKGTILPKAGPNSISLLEFIEPGYHRDYGLLKPMFRRALIGSQRYGSMRYGEDWDFTARLLRNGATIAIDRAYSGYLYTSKEAGFSVSPFNDQSLIDNTLNWIASTNDEAMLQALRRRLAFQRRLQLDRMAGKGKRATIMAKALQSPTGIFWLARWAASKLHAK